MRVEITVVAEDQANWVFDLQRDSKAIWIGADPTCPVHLSRSQYPRLQGRHACLTISLTSIALEPASEITSPHEGLLLNQVSVPRFVSSTPKGSSEVQLGSDGPKLLLRWDVSEATEARTVQYRVAQESAPASGSSVSLHQAPTRKAPSAGGSPADQEPPPQATRTSTSDSDQHGSSSPVRVGLRQSSPAEHRMNSDVSHSDITERSFHLQRDLRVLRKGLFVALGIALVFLVALLYQAQRLEEANRRLSEVRDALTAMEIRADESLKLLLPDLEKRLTRLEQKMDEIEPKMQAAENRMVARMERELPRILEREIPRILDKWWARKEAELRREISGEE